MSTPLRVAVIGTGSLGKEHARIYAELASSSDALQLAGVYDAHPASAEKIAAKCRTQVFPTIEAALAEADALSIVTPTSTHSVYPNV